MKNKVYLLILLLLLGHVVSSFAQKHEKHNLKGKEYYSQKNYTNAIESFTKAIKSNPNYAEAYYFRGRAYGMSGKYDESIKDLTKAINLDPDNIDYLSKRAYFNLVYKHYDKALIDYNWIIEVSPSEKGAYFSRGYTNYLLNRNEEALNDFYEEKVSNTNATTIYLYRAYAYDRLQMYDSALNYYSLVSKVDSNFKKETICYFSALDNYYLKQYKTAIPKLKKAYLKFPDSTNLLIRLCIAYYEVDDKPKTKEYLNQCLVNQTQFRNGLKGIHDLEESGMCFHLFEKEILQDIFTDYKLLLDKPKEWEISLLPAERIDSINSGSGIIKASKSKIYLKITGNFSSLSSSGYKHPVENIYLTYYDQGKEKYSELSGYLCVDGSIFSTQRAGKNPVYHLGQKSSTLILYFEIPKTVVCGTTLKFDNEFVTVLKPCK